MISKNSFAYCFSLFFIILYIYGCSSKIEIKSIQNDSRAYVNKEVTKAGKV